LKPQRRIEQLQIASQLPIDKKTFSA